MQRGERVPRPGLRDADADADAQRRIDLLETQRLGGFEGTEPGQGARQAVQVQGVAEVGVLRLRGPDRLMRAPR